MGEKRKVKLSEQTSDRLYEMIVDEGRYAPGSKLPNENELSEALKVSRTTLSAFLDAPSWADRLRAAQYPAAYLRSVLVGFLRRQPAQAAADAPLDAWELEWLDDFHHRKKKNS